MADDTDGIEEALEGQLRILITVAAQVGERLARERADQHRRVQANSEQEARALQSRFEGERAVVRARLATVDRNNGWWDRTPGPDIADTYQVARAWAREDPAIAQVEQRMAAQIRDRYGVDVTTTDPAAIRSEVIRAENTRGEVGKQRTMSAAEQAQAQILIAHADRTDDAREAAVHEPDLQHGAANAVAAEELEFRAAGAEEVGRLVYDSADRRDGTVRDLEAKGISQQAIVAKMTADVSQAHPATEAAKGGRRRAAKGRKNRGRAPQVERVGLDR